MLSRPKCGHSAARLVYTRFRERRPVKRPGRPQSSSRKRTLALPGTPLASGLRQSCSVAVHTWPTRSMSGLASRTPCCGEREVFTRQMSGQASRTRGHRAALQSALRPARCTARTRARRATRSSCGASRGHRTGDGAGGPPACTALRRFVQRSVQRSLVQRSVRRLHNHPCPTEHAHRVVHVRTAAGTRANGQCMPLPLLAHAQAEGSPAVAHNASFWRSTRLRLSSLAAGV